MKAAMLSLMRQGGVSVQEPSELIAVRANVSHNDSGNRT